MNKTKSKHLTNKKLLNYGIWLTVLEWSNSQLYIESSISKLIIKVENRVLIQTFKEKVWHMRERCQMVGFHLRDGKECFILCHRLELICHPLSCWEKLDSLFHITLNHRNWNLTIYHFTVKQTETNNCLNSNPSTFRFQTILSSSLVH